MIINPNWKTTEQLEHELKELEERYRLLEGNYNALYDENVKLYHEKVYYKEWVYSIVSALFITLILVILLYIKF